jgi:hypothetical protein
MSEHTTKGPRLVKRWKQAISRFIAFCLYGDQSPLEGAEARRMRAELSRQIEPENELLRGSHKK